MSNIHTLLIGNDTVLEVGALKNELTGGFLSGASVTVTLVDEDGAEVGGQVWPLALAYVTGSKGVYRTALGSTLALVEDGRYTANIVADGGAGLRAAWSLPCVARSRM